ncbi:PepSY domain-containing protein [Thiolapillus sp.]
MIFVIYWLWSETGEIEQVRNHRAAVKTAILSEIHARHQGRVINTHLDSRCGKAVYTVDLEEKSGSRHRFHYDIESGTPIDMTWLKDCMHL